MVSRAAAEHEAALFDQGDFATLIAALAAWLALLAWVIRS
jgi:hypothetical protein